MQKLGNEMCVFFVNGTVLHFTLNELCKVFSRLPSVLTALGFLFCLVAFSTYSDLRVVLWYKQVFFWITGVLVFLYCYVSGLIFVDRVSCNFDYGRVPEPLVMLIAATFVTFFMVPLASAMSPLRVTGLADLGRYTFYNFLLWETWMLMFVSFVLPRELSRVREMGFDKPTSTTPAACLTIGSSSWPIEKVVCVSAQDHYLKVCTLTETELVLGRLTDLAPISEGMIVHRSHWVNFTAIKAMEKSDRKLFLVLENEMWIPIARNRRSEVLERLSRLKKSLP